MTLFKSLYSMVSFILNIILDSVSEIKSGSQKKYPVLHRVAKGTEFEGLSRANIYKTWDHGLWTTIDDLKKNYTGYLAKFYGLI